MVHTGFRWLRYDSNPPMRGLPKKPARYARFTLYLTRRPILIGYCRGREGGFDKALEFDTEAVRLGLYSPRMHSEFLSCRMDSVPITSPQSDNATGPFE